MKYRGNVGLNVGWEISIDLANDLQNIAYQLLQRRGYKDVDAKLYVKSDFTSIEPAKLIGIGFCMDVLITR